MSGVSLSEAGHLLAVHGLDGFLTPFGIRRDNGNADRADPLDLKSRPDRCQTSALHEPGQFAE